MLSTLIVNWRDLASTTCRSTHISAAGRRLCHRVACPAGGYILAHENIHTHTDTHTCSYRHRRAQAKTHTHTHTHTHIYTHIHTQTRTHTHTLTHTHTHTLTYTQTHTRTHTQTYIYTPHNPLTQPEKHLTRSIPTTARDPRGLTVAQVSPRIPRRLCYRTQTFTQTQIQTRRHSHTHAHIHTRTHTHTHTQARTHTHTHTNAPRTTLPYSQGTLYHHAARISRMHHLGHDVECAVGDNFLVQCVVVVCGACVCECLRVCICVCVNVCVL